MKKTGKIVLLLTLVILLVGISSASEISENTTDTTIDTQVMKVVDNTQEVSQTNTVTNEKDIKKEKIQSIAEEKNNKTLDKNINTKNTKEAEVSNWNTLNSAIESAKQATTDTTITLQSGTYTASNTINWNNTLTVLTIDGNGQTIDGNGQRVFTITRDAILVLKNIIIKNANAEYGGAIYNDYSTLTIINSTLENNNATGGGALWNKRGTLTIINSTLENNNATAGGALLNEMGTSNIINSTLENNTANIDGGAIFNNNGILTIINSALENNTAIGTRIYNGGGALWNEKGTLTIINSTLENNNATRSGGAICSIDGIVTFSGNVFLDNHADTMETIDLYNLMDGEFINNTYEYTDINLTEIKLSIKDNKTTFHFGEDVVLNYSIQLANPNYYKDFKDGINDITLYINDEKNITTKYENTTLSILKPGNYTAYFTTCNQQSNIVTFNVKNSIEELENQIENLNNIIQEQNTTINNLNNTVEEQNNTINTLNDTVNNLNNTVQQQDATINELQEQMDELKKAKNTTITFDEITAKYNNEVTISGTLVNDDSIGLFNQIVTLTIDDTEINVTTKGGIFEYKTTFKELGEKTVTAAYAGNDKYRSSEATTTFNVEKQDIIITYNPISDAKYKDNVTITGKVTDVNGKGLYNINAIIKINGKLYKAKTAKNGAFTFTTTASAVGTNNVTLSYGGNTYYNSYKTSTRFNVEKQDIIIIYDPIPDAKYKDNVTISGKIVDANAKALYNINAIVTINGKVYKAKTDSTGLFTLTVPSTVTGTNNVTIGYGGNSYYNANETSTAFNVEKQDIAIECDPIVDTVIGDNVTIAGVVSDVTGQSLNNINVNVRINGKLFKAKTDSKGAFTLTTTVGTLGTNYVTLSYNGNNNYNSAETSTTFNVIEKTE